MVRRKKRLYGRRGRTRGLSRAPLATSPPMGAPAEGAPEETGPDDARLQDAYERVVIAAGKVLYESPSHETVMETISSSVDVENGIAEAVTTVLLQLYEKSRGTMPGEVILPAATEVIAMALELAQAAGVEGAERADPQRIFELLISKFIERGVVDRGEVQEFLQGMDPAELEKFRSGQPRQGVVPQQGGIVPQGGMIAGGMQQQPRGIGI